MKWSLCGKNDLVHLVEFILEKEWEHTFFSARLIDEDSFRLPAKTRFPIFILHEKNRIKAACMVTSWGGLFPVFKSIDPPDEKELKNLMFRLKSTLRKVYSIMGTVERVELLKPFLKSSKEVPVNYDLMIRKDGQREPLTLPDKKFSIHLATQDDSASLLGLEMEYMKEEVFIDPGNVDNSRVYHNLRTSLGEQIVYYVKDGILPIAKAGTNARGHKWNQIGGVYTEREYRNRGISTWLMDYLLRELDDQGKKTVLFVKESNPAAKKVYNKLGFESVKPFNITYYI